MANQHFKSDVRHANNDMSGYSTKDTYELAYTLHVAATAMCNNVPDALLSDYAGRLAHYGFVERRVSENAVVFYRCPSPSVSHYSSSTSSSSLSSSLSSIPSVLSTLSEDLFDFSSFSSSPLFSSAPQGEENTQRHLEDGNVVLVTEHRVLDSGNRSGHIVIRVSYMISKSHPGSQCIALSVSKQVFGCGSSICICGTSLILVDSICIVEKQFTDAYSLP